MNILLLAFLFLFGLSQFVLAQSSLITFGVRAGAGMSFLSENRLPPTSLSLDFETSSGFCFQGGGLVNIPLGGMWSIQSELLYSYEVVKQVDSDSGSFRRTFENGTTAGIIKYSSISYRKSFTSVCFPILFMASFGEQKSQQVNIYSGPTFGYILSGKATQNTNDSLGQSFSTSTYEILDMNRFRVGLTLGIDYHIFKNFFVDARFNYPITHYTESDWYKLRLSNALVGFGVVF